MGKINLKGVIRGGLLAGVVLNVVDYLLYGIYFMPDLEAVMQSMGNEPIGAAGIGLFVVLDFLYGIALVWLYAAIRPRFGPGPKTAVQAGLYLWVVYGLLHAIGEAQMGIFPMRVYVIGTVVALILFPVAAMVGGRFYSEGADAPAPPAM